MSTKDENQNEGNQALQLRWYCLSANGMATLALDKADAENVAAESDQLYPRNGPHVAVQMVPVQPDGRGTDAQIEKERDIARHAIVGAIAFGHAGNAHPGADHWLAAAHDAGATIARLERASHQVGGCQGDELKSMRHHFSPHAGQGGTPYDSEWASSAARTGQPPLACLSHPAESDLQQGLSITGEQPAAAGVSDAVDLALQRAETTLRLYPAWIGLADECKRARAILALRLQSEPDELSPDFTDTARAALLWVLWHHQGGSSPVGQPIRYALGMGAHESLNAWQVSEAKRWAAITGSQTSEFHNMLRPQAVPMTPEPKAAPKLIGWRTSDYLMETADKSKADNWSVHHEMLPIFEGDPHTKLGSHGITAQGAQEGV